MRLADIRFSGQVVGVGTDNIVGRIHAINLEIGGNFYDCSIYVIENAKIDMLFGLDMLKRHQCCIDLHKNVLTLNAGQFSVPFLSDAQIHRDGDEEFMDVDKVNNQNVEEKKVEEKKVEEKKVEVKKVEEKKVEEKKTEAPSLNAGNIARPTPASNSHPWEEKIMKIVKLGYSRDDALRALTSFNGNEDMAASYLFSRGSGFGFD
jgi:DNA damage-inducible protein 1